MFLNDSWKEQCWKLLGLSVVVFNKDSKEKFTKRFSEDRGIGIFATA